MNAAEIAGDLVDLIRSECEVLDNDGRRIVANRIAVLISDWLPKKGVVGDAKMTPMSDAEARMFGMELCPFRAHEGKFWDEVDLSYVEWIADASLKTARDLGRYLRSRRIKSESDRESDCV